MGVSAGARHGNLLPETELHISQKQRLSQQKRSIGQVSAHRLNCCEIDI